jgi:Glycosyltransferase family 92
LAGAVRSDERRRGKPYLSVCSCCGYDAPYLREWIEFHRLVGVERFFLYNSGDREAQRELLAPYVREGIVVLHDWPEFPPQIPAYDHAMTEHQNDSRWIAFIDTDEFLFSPTGRPLPEVLTEYEQWPGVGVCPVMFGTSGHRTQPPGLVIENYVLRLGNPKAEVQVKSIVDPTRVDREEVVNPHFFYYVEGHAVDELKRPLDRWLAASPSHQRLRINHYWAKSEEETRRKLARLRPDSGEPYPDEWATDSVISSFEGRGEPDEAILDYLPGLRRALGMQA